MSNLAADAVGSSIAQLAVRIAVAQKAVTLAPDAIMRDTAEELADESRSGLAGKLDPVIAAIAWQITRESEQANAQVVRQAIADIDQVLEKRWQFNITFGGEVVKVFTVNGDVVRKQVKDGGLGCPDFTMGMNGWAAREPMYRATGWCLEDEVCLHNLLSAATFLVVCVHEVTERWAMKWLKMSYDDGHDYVANPCENRARDWLHAHGFAEAV